MKPTNGYDIGQDVTSPARLAVEATRAALGDFADVLERAADAPDGQHDADLDAARRRVIEGQAQFARAFTDAGYQFPDGAGQGIDLILRHLRTTHGIRDADAVRGHVPGSPAWADRGGRNYDRAERRALGRIATLARSPR